MLPGSEGKGVTEVREALADAKRLGFPVLIKAAAGGGGKGMRVARDEKELSRLFALARAESEAAFGSRTMYLEKYLEHARHVEFQILADTHRNVIHMGERDCSIQRRHQKVLEEAPCPVMTARLREKMGKAAVRAAQVVGYSNVGTVEFLLAADGNFYFIEMNTRIQVEHGVTEMVTGVDLVRESLALAMGERLRLKQRQVDDQRRGDGVPHLCRGSRHAPAVARGGVESSCARRTWEFGSNRRCTTATASQCNTIR